MYGIVLLVIYLKVWQQIVTRKQVFAEKEGKHAMRLEHEYRTNIVGALPFRCLHYAVNWFREIERDDQDSCN